MDKRRGFVWAAMAVAMCVAGGRLASAAAHWPDRPVTVVVPYAAGGSTDIQARLIGEWLSNKLGQRFLVDNRPGAGGGTGTGFVGRAEPNGYTLLYGSGAQFAITPLIQKVTYETKDFAPIITFGVSPQLLAIHPSVPAKTMAEFIAYAKANPGKLSYASGGVGTAGHLSASYFLSKAGLDMVHVPYKGGAAAATDLLSGEVQMYFGNPSELLQHSAEGRIRIIATSNPTRYEPLPDVPAVAELYPGFSIVVWNGLLAPAGTPAAIVEEITRETRAALKDPAILARLGDIGVTAGGDAGPAMERIMAQESVTFREAVKAAGLIGN